MEENIGFTFLKNNPKDGRLVTFYYEDKSITLFYQLRDSNLNPYSYWYCCEGLPIPIETNRPNGVSLGEMQEIWIHNLKREIEGFEYLSIEPDRFGLWTP